MVRACVLAVVVLIAAPSFAHAAPGDAARAQAAMEDYFAGEKAGGVVLVGMGLAGLIAGFVLRRRSSATAKGASYVLFTMGVLHAAAGIYIHVASDQRVDELSAQIASDPEAFVTAERARMSGVATQLSALKIVEVGLIVGGLALVVLGTRKQRPRLTGIGLALIIEAALTLGFDVFAARRATTYRGELATSFTEAVVTPSGT
jgi:hypothetical protein